MAVNRLERVNSLLKREIGSSFFKVFAGDPLDLAAVTVTKVEVAHNLRDADVYISIFGHEQDRGNIMRRIAHHAGDFQKLINQEVRIKYTPRLRFILDESVEKGDHVLDLIDHLNIPEDDGESPSEPPRQQ